MNKIGQKIIIISTFLSIGALAACHTYTTSSEEPFVEEVITYEQIRSVQKEGLYLKPGEERTINVNYSLALKNINNSLHCNKL